MQAAEGTQRGQLRKTNPQPLYPAAFLVYADQWSWAAHGMYFTDQFFQLPAVREIT